MKKVKVTQYRRNLNKLIKSVLILIFLTSLTACKKEEPITLIWETLGMSKEEYALERMNERYGHEFIFIEDYPRTENRSEDVVFVKSKEFMIVT